ncbi:conserved oligomeric Golgi complex subunit 4 [Selaginella moellendorffii]|nr:conserved oligomeric Golgi complex subunit 4 [Selaginella moellendorffii]|eukprot:XP_002964874.2 conserved oligomeric Golgi complex subunit 4 [Selaginella moellendorffii]
MAILESPRVGAGMLDRIRSLTDVGTMNRMLHESIAYERSIDGELESLLAQRQEVEKKLLGLHRTGEVLEIVRADAEQMLRSVESTCSLANLVSGKVRELDLAQSRVQETLARIEAIVDRGSCIDGAQKALASEDYESAARNVERFLQLEERMGGLVDPASDQHVQLLESKRKLEEVIKKRFYAAVDARDHAGVVRFASLFAPLGLHEEGIKAYVSYLRRSVDHRARDGFAAVKETPDQADFVAALNNIFKDIAEAIEENEELLKSLNGEDGLVYAILELQEECDSRGSAIVKKYMEFRGLAKLEKEIIAQTNAEKDIVAQSKLLMSASGAVEGPDLRSIEMFLEEILLLIQTSEDYTQYMIGRVREAGSSGAHFSPRATTSFKVGSFYRAVQELTSHYRLLEEYFMAENVRKAIKLDEFPANSLTTSVVDDVFYVLQSCTRRAVSTSNVHLTLSIVTCAANLLGNEYKDALQRKMREPNLAMKLFAGGTGVVKVGMEVAAALNNMDVSAEYVLKLKAEIEEQCNEIFPGPAEREKLKSSLLELGEASVSLRQITNSGLEQLANCIAPRLRSTLDAVGTVSYELTEAQYAENEVNDPWVQKLLHGVEANVSWLQPLLTAGNYDTLVHLVIDFIVKRLEVVMGQKHFNQLGGLQLDRDARALVGHFSGMTQRTVRDKFARLSQMATILNLEKVSEILDYWGENSGPMTWRLTPNEVRRVLGLRLDFKPDAIAALKL